MDKHYSNFRLINRFVLNLFQLAGYHFVVHSVAYQITQEDERFCHFPYAVSGFRIFSLLGKKFDSMAKKNQQEYHFIFVTSNGKQLTEVAKILEQHQIKPSIDSVFPFEQASEALHKIAHKPSQGKTVLSLEHL